MRPGHATGSGIETWVVSCLTLLACCRLQGFLEQSLLDETALAVVANLVGCKVRMLHRVSVHG